MSQQIENDGRHIPDKGQVIVRYYEFYSNAHRGTRICMWICGGVDPELLESSLISRFLLLFLPLTRLFSVL